MQRYMVTIDETVVANNIGFGYSFFERLIGLLRHKELKDGEGLLISKCKQIHTFGMKFNIDAVFLSDEAKVVYIEENIKPGRISKYVKEADKTLELKAGTVTEQGIKLGETMNFKTL